LAEAAEQRNSDVSLGLDTLYSESAATFRHYSNCSLTIRLSVIIQGLAILSASGYLFLQDQFSYSLAAAMFGLYFTTVLFFIYWAYDAACGEFQRSLSELEQIVVKAGSMPTKAAPFVSFAAMRERRFRKFPVRALTLYGAFTSVGFAFFILAIFSGLAWLRS
jgi:hypothetical protein